MRSLPTSADLDESIAANFEGDQLYEHAHVTASVPSYAFVVAFVAGFGFFVPSFVVLGIVPPCNCRQRSIELRLAQCSA
jgi:hypothetical protein